MINRFPISNFNTYMEDLPFCLYAYCTLEGEESNHVAPFETVDDAIEFFNKHFKGEHMKYAIFRYSSPEDWKEK